MYQIFQNQNYYLEENSVELTEATSLKLNTIVVNLCLVIEYVTGSQGSDIFYGMGIMGKLKGKSK